MLYLWVQWPRVWSQDWAEHIKWHKMAKCEKEDVQSRVCGRIAALEWLFFTCYCSFCHLTSDWLMTLSAGLSLADDKWWHVGCKVLTMSLHVPLHWSHQIMPRASWEPHTMDNTLTPSHVANLVTKKLLQQSTKFFLRAIIEHRHQVAVSSHGYWEKRVRAGWRQIPLNGLPWTGIIEQKYEETEVLECNINCLMTVGQLPVINSRSSPGGPAIRGHLACPCVCSSCQIRLLITPG